MHRPVISLKRKENYTVEPALNSRQNLQPKMAVKDGWPNKPVMTFKTICLLLS